MKILVLGSRIPFPLHDGGAIATYGMLKELASQGCEVVYFSLNTKKHLCDRNTINRNFDFCRVIDIEVNTDVSVFGALSAFLSGKNYNISRFFSKKASRRLMQLLDSESFDVVHFEGLYSTPFLKDVNKYSKEITKVYRSHNVEFKIWENLALKEESRLKKRYLEILVRGLRKYEIQTMRQFRYIASISKADTEVMASLSPGTEFFYYPAGFVLPDVKSGVSPEPLSLYHLGSMEWQPNQEGLQWFLDEVWPLVLSQFPDALFYMAGKGLVKNDARFIRKGVVNCGEIDDSAAFHQKYRIMIVPLHSGSGLRMKTLEAMSLGRLVLSTHLGMVGIPAIHGTHALIADEPEEWLKYIVAVFSGEIKDTELTVNAANLVKSEFDLKARTSALIGWYQKLTGK